MPSESRAIFVRNVPYKVETQDLKDLFEKYGKVADVYMPLDYYTRRPRGFAYVKYETQEEADQLVENKDIELELDGGRLEIDWAVGDRKSRHEMRKSDSRGGGRRNRSRSRSRDRYRRRERSRSPYRRRSRSRSPDYRRRDRDDRRDDKLERRDDDRESRFDRRRNDRSISRSPRRD